MCTTRRFHLGDSPLLCVVINLRVSSLLMLRQLTSSGSRRNSPRPFHPNRKILTSRFGSTSPPNPPSNTGIPPTSTIKDSLPDSPISPTSPTSELKKAVPTLDKTTTTHGRFPSTYSTGDPESCDEKSLAAHSSSGEWEAQGVEIRFGRPDVHALLEEVVTTSEGAVSIDGAYWSLDLDYFR